MGLTTRLYLVLLMGVLLTCKVSYAQQIRYSFGPVCKENKIICPDFNEIPVCLSTDSRVHVEQVIINDEKVDQYKPSCGALANDSMPTCLDVLKDGAIAPDHIVIACVEFPKCKLKETSNKLVAACSQGKIAKCLGDDEEPDCALGDNSVCRKGVAVCDYTWQANAQENNYQ